MKKVLFATTAFTALAVGGAAMADISLFGEARLGLYYEEDADNELTTESRVRFGVDMSGETDSGIVFGATLEAHNVTEGSEQGRAGSAFVSGQFGTLTLGDTNGADEQWVGDLVGNVSLTGLSDFNETAFVSNGGNFGNDDTYSFADNASARPTIRYDFDIAGFGISLSSNESLSDIGVGTGYVGPVGGFDIEVGVGYYNFEGFETDPTFELNETTGLIDQVAGAEIDDGEQWSALLGFAAFGADMNIIYNNGDAGDVKFQTVGIGAEYAFDAFTAGAFYRIAFDTDDVDDVLELDSDDDVFGFTGAYDLGGGASINGGIVNTYAENWIADFGVNMAF